MRTVYITEPDGKEFDDPNEARRWEEALGLEGTIQAYLAQAHPSLTPKGIVQRTNVILAWEKDRDQVLMISSVPFQETSEKDVVGPVDPVKSVA